MNVVLNSVYKYKKTKNIWSKLEYCQNNINEYRAEHMVLKREICKRQKDDAIYIFTIILYICYFLEKLDNSIKVIYDFKE